MTPEYGKGESSSNRTIAVSAKVSRPCFAQVFKEGVVVLP